MKIAISIILLFSIAVLSDVPDISDRQYLPVVEGYHFEIDYRNVSDGSMYGCLIYTPDSDPTIITRALGAWKEFVTGMVVLIGIYGKIRGWRKKRGVK